MGEKRKGRTVRLNELGPGLGKQSLIDAWEKRHGLPETLVVDRGRDFNRAVGDVLARLLERPGHDEKSETERPDEEVEILIQRVEFDQNGNPVLVHDSIRLEPPPKPVKKEGNHHEKDI